MRNRIIVTPCTGECVSVSEMKTHLRIDSTAEDGYIGSLITVARMGAENYMRRTVLPTVHKLFLDSFNGDTAVIELPRGAPLSTVSSNVVVTYYKDTTTVNDSTTVASTIYAVDYNVEPARIYPIYDNEWPDDYTTEKRDAVQIQYTAGYPSVADVPMPIKHYIKMKVASLYEMRTPTFEGTFYNQLQTIPFDHFTGLLDPYVVIDIDR